MPDQLRVSISGKAPTNMDREKGMERADRVLLAQLRCGQCRLLGSYRKAIGITDDERCRWCLLAVESVVHVFEECQSRVVRRMRRENGVRNRAAMTHRPGEAVKFVRELLREVGRGDRRWRRRSPHDAGNKRKRHASDFRQKTDMQMIWQS